MLMRLSGSSPGIVTMSIRTHSTGQCGPSPLPAARTSVAATVAPFPPLWLNELEADNLTGLTNRAGQHTPWLELYNPGTNVISLERTLSRQ